MSRIHKLVVVTAALVVGLVTFVVTSSFADSPGPSSSPLPDKSFSDLPAYSLPPASLDSAEAGQVQASVNGFLGQRAGLTTSDVRLLGNTALGPMYVLFGTKRVCLLLETTLTCGDPDGSSAHAVAAFGTDSAGNMVGGGIFAAGDSSATVTSGESSAAAESVPGGFILSPTAQLSQPSGVHGWSLAVS